MRTWVGAAALFAGAMVACSIPPAPTLDPAAWGGDHTGEPLPDYVTGGECLFCHRNTIGIHWNDNAHNRTTRPAMPDEEPLRALQAALDTEVGEVEFLLGAAERVRFLKGIGYGKVSLLSARWDFDEIRGASRPRWDDDVFAESCAGCHTTAVDSRTRAFSSLGLDCFACHGDVDLEHTADPQKVLLAGDRGDPARVVISICAQCHVRSGRSRSSGRPYPSGFIAGDNVFRDFAVDFSDEALAELSTADRHVVENVREVVVWGRTRVTCLSCHDVHAGSTRKHRLLRTQDSCFLCHVQGEPKTRLRAMTKHSRTCER